MTPAKQDNELFENSFGEWLENHGVELIGNNPSHLGTWQAMVDMNELKLAIMQLITADRERVALEAYNAMTEGVVNHLEHIEKEEGGSMLDLAALSGVLEHDEDARFARDRLVSERRACAIIYSVAAELKAQQEEE